MKDFTYRIIAGANVATIVLMLLVGYSDRVNPADHSVIGVVGLAFPVLLALNMAFLVFWLCTRKRWALIPFLGFVVGYGPVSVYCPLSMLRDAPDGAIKVLTYNVYNFHGWADDERRCEITDYIINQDADIVCLQEAEAPMKWRADCLDSIFAQRYPYRETALSEGGGSDALTVLSKYPIVGHEHIEYASAFNHSEAYWLAIGRDTVLLINNHLESTALPQAMRRRFKTLVKGELDGDSMKTESKALVAKLAESTARRAPQADSVAAFIERHQGTPVILCGDFNDSPISYVRHTIARQLIDCYADTGNGPGISYHYNGFWVRIDNMMCSTHFTPYRCTVDRSISASDHYPVYCWLKFKGR